MRAIALIGIAAALASAPTVSAEPSDTCSLLTRAEVAKAIGTRTVTAAHLASGAACSWAGPGTGRMTDGRLIVRIDVTPGMSRSTFLHMRQLTFDTATVRGVGQLAYRHHSELAVYDHGYWIEVTSVLVPSAIAVETQLATLFVKRLTESSRTGSG